MDENILQSMMCYFFLRHGVEQLLTTVYFVSPSQRWCQCSLSVSAPCQCLTSKPVELKS